MHASPHATPHPAAAGVVPRSAEDGTDGAGGLDFLGLPAPGGAGTSGAGGDDPLFADEDGGDDGMGGGGSLFASLPPPTAR